MHLLEKIRRYENIHIAFWLVKDTCWMLELKVLGAIMIVPTLSLALYIAAKTRHTRDIFLNVAVFFWILANSYWMVIEFFNDDKGKNYAAIPFGLGFLFVIIYYLSPDSRKQSDQA